MPSLRCRRTVAQRQRATHPSLRGMPRPKSVRPPVPEARASPVPFAFQLKRLSHYTNFCLHNGKEGLASTVRRRLPVERLCRSSAASTGGTLKLTFTVAVYEVRAAATEAAAPATGRRLLACRVGGCLKTSA